MTLLAGGLLLLLAHGEGSMPVMGERHWQRAQSQASVRVLVLWRPEAKAQAMLAQPTARWQQEATSARHYPLVGLPALPVGSALLPERAQDARVAAVSPVFSVRALRKDGKALMRVGEVQKLGFSGRGVGVAVLDTGVDYGHGELAPGGTNPLKR